MIHKHLQVILLVYSTVIEEIIEENIGLGMWQCLSEVNLFPLRFLQLKRRIYKGIPNAMRCEVWKKLLGLDRIPNKTHMYEVQNISPLSWLNTGVA